MDYVEFLNDLERWLALLVPTGVLLLLAVLLNNTRIIVNGTLCMFGGSLLFSLGGLAFGAHAGQAIMVIFLVALGAGVLFLLFGIGAELVFHWRARSARLRVIEWVLLCGGVVWVFGWIAALGVAAFLFLVHKVLPKSWKRAPMDPRLRKAAAVVALICWVFIAIYIYSPMK